MLWTIVYSPVVLYELLPTELYSHWCTFSNACAYLCKPYISKLEVEKADDLLVSFCNRFEMLYGTEACTPNMHMHMHLKECILDAGPIYTFWCFSFERYNGFLGAMNRLWRAPEQQLIHKFNNLQMLSAVELPDGELLNCFQQARHQKNSLPDVVTNSSFMLEYEKNLFCSPDTVSAKKLDLHQLIPPGREKILCETDRQHLHSMYMTIYGNADCITHVPLKYTRYSKLRIFNQLYTSKIAGTARSSIIIAIWPHLTDITTETTISKVRVGVIEYFMVHAMSIKSTTGDRQQQHLLARVAWFHDHPIDKFLLGNGTILSATVTDCTHSSSFMPVCRIISRCASLETTLQSAYGEDKVMIAVPVRKSFLL